MTKERGLCEIKEGKYFRVQTEQTMLIMNLLYGFWFIFYLSSEFAVTNPVSFFVSILVYTNLAFIYRVFKQTALKKTSSNVQAHSIVRNI